MFKIIFANISVLTSVLTTVYSFENVRWEGNVNKIKKINVKHQNGFYIFNLTYFVRIFQMNHITYIYLYNQQYPIIVPTSVILFIFFLLTLTFILSVDTYNTVKCDPISFLRIRIARWFHENILNIVNFPAETSYFHPS